MRIAVITGTTRKGRITPHVSQWVMNTASNRNDAEFVSLDLKDFDLPMLAEAPWLPDRELTDGAKRWLDELAQADGYIFVTAEYNHGVPAVLKNAIDYTAGQLKRKPFAIVSQGVNSGVRANEHLRQILNSMIDAVPISATVTFFGQVTDKLDENGNEIADNELNNGKLQNMLDDIVWYTAALSSARSVDEQN